MILVELCYNLEAKKMDIKKPKGVWLEIIATIVSNQDISRSPHT